MAKAFIPHNKVMKSEKYGSLSFCEIQFGENVDDPLVGGIQSHVITLVFFCFLIE